MLSKVKEGYEEGKSLKAAFTLSERRRVLKRIKKAKEPIMDLIGAKSENPLFFLPSLEETLLKTLYEVLLPRAQRSGKNEILVPKGEKGTIKDVLDQASRLGISIKEVPLDKDGKVTKELLEKAITKRTLAFFLSWAEPKVGTIHPLFELSVLCKEEEVFLFVDGTESLGKVFFRMSDMNVDLFAFDHGNITLVCAKDETILRGATWGEDFSLVEYFAFSAFAKDTVENMDFRPMEYSILKNKAIDHVKSQAPTCRFYNEGADYLFDRWCFSFDGVVAENLAFHLREANIDTCYLGVGSVLQGRGDDCSGALSMTFSIETPEEKLLKTWDTIVLVAKRLKGYTHA